MLSLKKLDRLFAKYNINPAEDQFLAMLHEAARLKTEVTVPEVEWTPEEMQDALHGKKPLFASRFIQSPREEFLRVFAAIRAVADASVPSGDPCLNIPEPEAFFTQDTLDALAKYPDALWDRIEEAGMDLTLAELYFVPVTAFAMRVFLDDAATEASRVFDRMVPDTVHFKRSITCPVCGTRASMAAVGATQNRGNVKRLYCACCGADWQFERIRCAVCGDEATSELQYVHLEGDDKHRLHVCSACESSVATVFGAESEDFDPDFESWRCAELMVAYAQTRKQAQQDVSQAGNA